MTAAQRRWTHTSLIFWYDVYRSQRMRWSLKVADCPMCKRPCSLESKKVALITSRGKLSEISEAFVWSFKKTTAQGRISFDNLFTAKGIYWRIIDPSKRKISAGTVLWKQCWVGMEGVGFDCSMKITVFTKLRGSAFWGPDSLLPVTWVNK